MKKPKQILVTGSTGFIGKYLVNKLEEEGHNVYQASRSLGFNVCDKESLKSFKNKDVEVIYHLAGNTFVPDSWNYPSRFYETNAIGTQNILEFCRYTGIKMIYISAYVYGAPEYLPMDEKHPVNPNNPYAHSKWMGEELCRFYSNIFKVKTTILRPFNIYGKGQRYNFLIPSLINQLKQGKIVVKDDTPKRDYIHIDDFIKACELCLNLEDEKFTLFNVGNGVSHSVKEVVDILINLSGREDVKYYSLNEKRPNEIPDTIADYSLIKEKLSWTPKYTLEQGLKELLNQTM